MSTLKVGWFVRFEPAQVAAWLERNRIAEARRAYGEFHAQAF